MATLKNVTINDTGFVKIPTGNTASRPGSVNPGTVRWNTQTSQIEIYSGSSWVNYVDNTSPSGGMVPTFAMSFTNGTEAMTSLSMTNRSYFNTSDIQINIGGWSATSGSITVPYAGIYRIFTCIHWEWGPNTDRNGGSIDYRPRPAHEIYIGNQSTGVRADQAYIRHGQADSATNHLRSSSEVSLIQRMSEGSTVQVYMARANDTYRNDCRIRGSESIIYITRLGA